MSTSLAQSLFLQNGELAAKLVADELFKQKVTAKIFKLKEREKEQDDAIDKLKTQEKKFEPMLSELQKQLEDSRKKHATLISIQKKQAERGIRREAFRRSGRARGEDCQSHAATGSQ